MSLDPARHNFTIYKGATFRKRVTLLTGGTGSSARDLTNYSASLVIRKSPSDPTIYLTLTESSGLTLGGVAGTIDIVISAATTGALTWQSGTYHLYITAPSAGDTDAILWGAFKVVTI